MTSDPPLEQSRNAIAGLATRNRQPSLNLPAVDPPQHAQHAR
jgi:hypothetical protein